MPLLVIDQEGQKKVFDYVEDDVPHILVSAGIGLIARNPYVSLGVAIVHGIYHFTEPYRDSRGVGGPSGTTPNLHRPLKAPTGASICGARKAREDSFPW